MSTSKSNETLPGRDERLTVVEEIFVKGGLLDRPRSIKPETLADKTDGLSIEEMSDLAMAFADNGKLINAAAVSAAVRAIQAKRENTDEETPAEAEVAPKDEEAPGAKSLKEIYAEMSDFKADPAEFEDPKRDDEQVDRPHVSAEVVVVVDATRNMRNMENAIERGLAAVFREASSFDGVKVKAVLLGKSGAVIDQGDGNCMPPHDNVSCRGRADVLDELIHAMRDTAKEQKKLPKRARPDKTVVALIADMSKIGKGELSADAFSKKLTKRRYSDWDIVVAAYGLSDKAARKRSLDPDEVIKFDRTDEDSVVSAFTGVASMIGSALADAVKE